MQVVVVGSGPLPPELERILASLRVTNPRVPRAPEAPVHIAVPSAIAQDAPQLASVKMPFEKSLGDTLGNIDTLGDILRRSAEERKKANAEQLRSFNQSVGASDERQCIGSDAEEPAPETEGPWANMTGEFSATPHVFAHRVKQFVLACANIMYPELEIWVEDAMFHDAMRDKFAGRISFNLAFTTDGSDLYRRSIEVQRDMMEGSTGDLGGDLGDLVWQIKTKIGEILPNN